MLPDQTEIAELIRVAIVEDHKTLREGMEWMLGSSSGYVCIGAYGSCEEALANWEKDPLQSGDVVLMDVGLPGMSGTQGAGQVKQHYPEAQVIMLTMRDETDIILEAIQAGAVGYLLKSTPPNEILQAIQTVIDGGSSLSGPVAMRILEQFNPNNNRNIKEFNLSEREMQILQGLVDGLTYKMLAESLFISIDTVRSHIKKLYEKLHVHSRNEAVAVAVNRGIRPEPK
ncbi:MAG: response regulator transcription factor [Bacteroidota bacterium]